MSTRGHATAIALEARRSTHERGKLSFSGVQNHTALALRYPRGDENTPEYDFARDEMGPSTKTVADQAVLR